jgi:hypothetical protein
LQKKPNSEASPNLLLGRKMPRRPNRLCNKREIKKGFSQNNGQGKKTKKSIIPLKYNYLNFF